MDTKARIVAFHGALWSNDPWYRWSWCLWPAALATLIVGWIFLSKPANDAGFGGAGSWAKPIVQKIATPPMPAPGTTTQPVNPIDLEMLSCFSNHGASSEAACTKLIDGGKISDAKLASVYTQRGFLQRETKPADASSDFNAALKIQPDFVAALNNRAWMSMTQGEYDSALPDLNKAIGLTAPSVTTAIARYYRGFAYLRLKDHPKALTDLNEALRLQPNNADYYLARGEAQEALGNYEAALSDFDEFSKRAQKDPRGLLARAVILEATGKPQDALAALESAITVAPDNAFARSERDRLRGLVDGKDPAKDNPGNSSPPT